ncbi:MAG: cation:proton antiporter [Pseudomonadales bacterium]|nr:cation:proton antiporter [Pseudomonadales bacterium]
MIPDLIGQILFLSGVAIVGMLIHRLLRFDLTLACLGAGVLAGWAVPLLGIDTGIRAHSLQELVFFVILPVLIFEATWHLDPALLRRWLSPIVLLATLGVLISCFVTAGLVYFGIGHPAGFPWIAALLTGAILAATDPIAVVSQLKTLNAPSDLGTLFEGESLFNDGAAVVLFVIVFSFATGSMVESSGHLVFFSTVFFGGLVLGALLGLVAAIVVLLLGKVPATSVVLVFTAFGGFYLAEEILHISGIMTIVASALVSRIVLREQSAFLSGIADTWSWLGLLFNSLLFVLMGLVITWDMFRERWLAMVIAIAAALAARAVAVGFCGLLTQPMLRPIPGVWQILLFWGGLRGAVAVALVLSLPVTLSYWWTIQSMVFGVVIFSLLVQGTTFKPLMRYIVKK